MPKIEEYTSTKELRPNDVGFSALETAARRVGPLAQQSAADIEKQGKMAAEFAVNANKFAYEFTSPFADLLDKQKGGGIKQGKEKVERTLIGTGSGGSRDNNSSANLAGQAVKYNGPDVATGAAKLSSRLKNAVAPGGTSGAVDPISGQPISSVQPGQQQQYWKDPETGKVTPIPQDPAQQALNPGVTVLHGGQGPSPDGVSIIRGGQPGASIISVGEWTGGVQPMRVTATNDINVPGAQTGGPIAEKYIAALPVPTTPIGLPAGPGQLQRDAQGHIVGGRNMGSEVNKNTIQEQPLYAPGTTVTDQAAAAANVAASTSGSWFRNASQAVGNFLSQTSDDSGTPRDFGPPTQDIPTPVPVATPIAPPVQDEPDSTNPME